MNPHMQRRKANEKNLKTSIKEELELQIGDLEGRQDA